MNQPNFDPSAASRRRKTTLAWLFSLVLLMLFVFVGGWLWLTSGPNPNGNAHPLPSGQLQADARTFVAAVRYLMTPETDLPLAPATPLIYSNLLAFQSSAPALSGFPSNMAEFPAEPATNRPGRS